MKTSFCRLSRPGWRARRACGRRKTTRSARRLPGIELIDSLLLPGRDFYRRYCLPECFGSRRCLRQCLHYSQQQRLGRMPAPPPIQTVLPMVTELSGFCKCKETVTSGFQTRRRVYRMKSGINLNVRCGRRIIAGCSLLSSKKHRSLTSQLFQKILFSQSTKRAAGSILPADYGEYDSILLYLSNPFGYIPRIDPFALWPIASKLPAGIFSRPVIPPAISIFISTGCAIFHSAHGKSRRLLYVSFPA